MCIVCGVVHWAHAKTHAAHTAVRRLIRNTGLDEHYTACECFHRDCPVIGARTFSHAFDEYNVNTYFCCVFFFVASIHHISLSLLSDDSMGLELHIA